MKTVHLHRVRDGHELAGYIARAEASLIDNPPLTRQTEEHLKGLLQDVTDLVDIWGDMTITQHLESESSLSDYISVLDELGIHTYANIVEKPMTSPTGPWNMKVLVLYLNSTDVDKAITRVEID